MDPKIFKAYDIRGRVPEQLDAGMAFALGSALANLLHPRTVVVGQDMRTSSPEIFRQLTGGLLEHGVEVLDIGLAPTPLMYFAVQLLEADAGVNITASHNPKDDNGFKLVREHAIPISGETGIYELRDHIVAQQKSSITRQPGSVRTIQGMLERFVQRNIELLQPLALKPLRVVIDSGNGMASVMVDELFRHFPMLGLDHLYAELDGTFPNHPADPLKPENLVDCQQRIQATHANLGVVFDGDGDRMVMIDERGEPISADLLTALIAQQVLAVHPGATVMADLRSSLATMEAIREAGGQALMCRVGHSYIKQQMRENGAIFAGELSGHLYFKEIGVYEAPLMALLMILQRISATDQPLSELIRPFRRYVASGEINSEVEDKDGKMKELEQHFQSGAKEISWLDGIRVQMTDWWFNVRPSNTEPLLRLNLEAKDQRSMEEKRDLVLQRIRSKTKTIA